MTERERFDAYWLARQRARGFGDRLTDAEMLAHPDRREDEFHAWVAARADSTEAQAEITAEQLQRVWYACGLGKEWDVPADEDQLRFARAAVLALRAPRQAPKPSAPIYYMRDNHTFKLLIGTVDEMVAAIKVEFDAGFTYGALCSKQLGFKDVQAHGLESWNEFEAEVRAALGILPTSEKL